MSFTYVTITHTFETAADIPASGAVDFTPIVAMRNTLTVVQKTVTATLNGSGAISQLLAANTDPDTVPTGTTYKVVERINGQPQITYFIQIPHDQGATIDLRALAGWQPAEFPELVVTAINGEGPDGTGNVVVSASDVGAQPSAVPLTRLSAAPVTITYAASITPDAAFGCVHRVTATGDVAVTDIINGVDGQDLTLEVLASGADRMLTIGGVPELIAVGTWWIGTFRYDEPAGTWKLSSGGGSSVDDEAVRDIIGATLVAGSNITITPSDVADTVTIAASAGASGIPASTVNAKGDLIAGTADDTVDRLAVGTNGQALVANSATSTGLVWTAPTPATHSHAAADLTSGTVATGLLGSGTANSTTFLRGDNTWASPTAGSSTVTHNTQTGSSYTAVLSDAGKVVEHNNASANTHTVPPNSSVAFPVGTYYSVRQMGAGQTSLSPGAGVTFVSRLGGTGLKLAGQWAEATLTQRAGNTWHVSGEITL